MPTQLSSSDLARRSRFCAEPLFHLLPVHFSVRRCRSSQARRLGALFLCLCWPLGSCGVYDYQLGVDAIGSEVSDASPGVVVLADGSTPNDTSFDLVGWASTLDCGPEGTTGGAGGPTVSVRTASELDEAVRASGPLVIEVSGSIELLDLSPLISSDKTLLGVDGAELVGPVRVYNARNVILSNLKFNGGATEGNTDALEVTGSSCVWIDHCEFFDGSDGNLDIVRGSDLITVSWSRFYYAARSHPHRLSTLCGSDNEDTPGKLNVTFHHNWWGADVLEQMPRVRHGRVHLFNNYYSASGNNYCIGAGYLAKLLVQNNVFDGVANPIVFQFDEEVEGSGVHTAEVVETGNDYGTASGEQVSRGVSFEPPYAYSLQPVELTKESVMAQAGVQPSPLLP